MFKKLPVLALLAFSSCAIVYSQKAPEAPKSPEKAPKAAVWTFSFSGGSFLGVETQEVTKENYAKFGLSGVRGVAVEKVVENSPAAQAGIQAGDVIVRFEGEEVTSVRKLTRLISEVAPDHQVKITVLRGGSEQEITATLGKREMPEAFNGNFKMPEMPPMPEMPQLKEMPQMPQMPQIPDGNGSLTLRGDGDNVFYFGSNRQIGVSVSSLTKQLGEYFGIGDGAGLLINNVRENSPAAKAGLKAGDVIVEADGKAVKNNVDLIRAVNEKKDGDVTLTIVRDRNRQTVTVTPEKLKGGVFNGAAPMNFQMRMPSLPQTPLAPVAPIRIL
ncbi:MAG: PDZ domain-containing protein [Acidobacteria bacterium]|nr:PDZ domain-containing protein [Acidobacteriota bacterium]